MQPPVPFESGLLVRVQNLLRKSLLFFQIRAECLPQPLHHFKSGRADLGVFQREIEYLMEVFAIGVRVFAAGFGAHFVDGAIIVGTEEGTGGGVEHIIAVFVYVEVALYEFGGAQAEVAGDALNVYVAEDGTGGFAAIGASEAVNFAEDRFVQTGGHFV